MSVLISELRPFWVRGLNEVNGRSYSGLTGWIDKNKGYVVYDQISAENFDLYITDQAALSQSFGYDINRFGTAAFESMNEIFYYPAFPNSNAWKCIKAYYAAYYSAHAILRMFGVSCTNFERETLSKVEKIADAYGCQNGISINKGYYTCVINTVDSKLLCSKNVVSGNKGSHEQLWEIFLNKLNFIITEIGKKSSTIEIQKVIVKLFELRDNLTYMGCNGGNWLSKIRNDISYKHLYGVWHPYNDYEDYYREFETILRSWKADPSELEIGIYIGKSLLRFISTCVFLVALFKDLAVDMSNRCPKGHSFLTSSSLSFYNKANAF